MPYVARKQGKGKKPWAIVNKNTGRVVGKSSSKKKASVSASIRNGTHGKR